MQSMTRASLSIAALLVAAWPAPATAQDARPTLLQPTDSALAIVPARPLEEIEEDLEIAAQMQMATRNRRMRAEAGEQTSDRYVNVTETEIKSVEQQLDLAKDQGREAEKLALETEKKALEELKKFHERDRELRKAETELAKARLEQAEATEAALNLERELAVQRSRSLGSGLSSASQMQVLAELEKRTLEAQKEMFERDRRVADRGKTVTERRLQLFDARRKLFES